MAQQFNGYAEDVTGQLGLFGQQPRGLIPRFYYEFRDKRRRNPDTLEDEPLYDDNGLVVREPVEMIEIAIVGNNRRTIRRTVQKADREFYAPSYRAWKDGEEQKKVDGPTLDLLPGFTTAAMQICNLHNVFTITQLAELDDQKIGVLGRGAEAWRSQAQVWLTRARDGAGDTKLAQELAELRKMVAALQERAQSAEAERDGLTVAVRQLGGVEYDEEEEEPKAAKGAKAKAKPAKAKRGRPRKAPGTSTAEMAAQGVESMHPNAVPWTPGGGANAGDNVPSSDDNPFADGDGSYDPVAVLDGE